MPPKQLSPKQAEELLRTLKSRFEKHMNRHTRFEWPKVQARLEANPDKLWSLNEMEATGGEPDVVGFDAKSSSWLQTPESIRQLGGAIYGDWRYGRVFTYHNGAESYYAVRGFRGSLKV